MGRTLASFPWPVYDSIRSWCSQVCVCVSPRFVSAPGHAGHAPPSLFPPPHSHAHLPFPAHRWEERGREREKQPFHPGFEVHEGRRSLGRTSRHTPRFQTHSQKGNGRAGEQTHSNRSRYTTRCAAAPPRVQGGRHHPSSDCHVALRGNFRIQTRDGWDRCMRWIRHWRPSNRGERRMRDACYVRT